MKKSFYELCKDAGTDKVMHHGYHFLSFFLEKLRNEKFTMLEIGYGSGESAKMWCEYFPYTNFSVLISIPKLYTMTDAE